MNYYYELNIQPFVGSSKNNAKYQNAGIWKQEYLHRWKYPEYVMCYKCQLTSQRQLQFVEQVRWILDSLIW